MMTSEELNEFLNKYNDKIDHNHINVFLKMINELRMYNNINTPFIYFDNNFHKYDCDNIQTKSFNICACKSYYNQYMYTLKLYNLYKRIFNFSPKK